MDIIGISGSPRGRKSSTRKLVERVLEGAQSAGAQVELADLGEMNITYCVACDTCHIKGPCSRKDDIIPLKEKMLTADGLVFGSPLYFNSVSAQLKTMIDRLPQVVHCQQFLGTYACSVATSGSDEYDMALTYMNDLLVRLGCTVVGGAGAGMSTSGSFEAAEQNAITLGRDLVLAINEKREYPEQDRVHAEAHERFKWLITSNRDHWLYEYNYWRERGWL